MIRLERVTKMSHLNKLSHGLFVLLAHKNARENASWQLLGSDSNFFLIVFNLESRTSSPIVTMTIEVETTMNITVCGFETDKAGANVGQQNNNSNNKEQSKRHCWQWMEDRTVEVVSSLVDK